MTKQLFTRPYPLSAAVLVPAVVFALIAPCYLVIGAYARGRMLHQPALALDRALPVLPLWTLVYGSLWMAVFLPMVVLRDEEHIWRTLWAFVLVWAIGAIGWSCYPTTLPRPTPAELGEGFGAWTLQIAYGMDRPYNCFPCLHVAQPFLAAFTCQLVSRRLGRVALVWATFVFLSTLFTKQHYIVDGIAGVLMAAAAHRVCLRRYARTAIPQLDERVVTVVLLGFAGVHALLIAGFGVAYLLG